MGEFTLYIIKASVYTALFFLFYKLFLSRETLHKFNRVLLLSIVILSFVLPFVKLSIETSVAEVGDPGLIFKDLFYVVEDSATEEASPVWARVLVTIYFAGVAGAFIALCISYIKMLIIIRRSGSVSEENGIKMRISDSNISPFSWMNTYVISRSDYEKEGEIVAIHERAHILKRHSVDIMISQIALLFQWFNPAIYLLKQELQSIHEYQADEAVINYGIDAKKYQLLLIRKAVGQRLFAMANSFNHGELKKRITMMVREKSKKGSALKALLLAPAAAIALIAFASEKVSAKTEIISKADIVTLAGNNTPVLSDTIKVKTSGVKKEIKIIKRTGAKDIFLVNGKEVPADSMQNITIHVDSTSGVTKYMKIRIVTKDSASANFNTSTVVVKGERVNGQFIVKDSASKHDVGSKKVVLRTGTGGDVLVIVDGKEYPGYDKLDPNKIESVSVLKDEAATKLYGEKGKNGVIIIVTKTAK